MHQSSRTAALMLLYPKEETHLVLIVRNSYRRAFSSSSLSDNDFTILFYENTRGGKSRRSRANVFYPNVYVPPSNFMVHPFLGIAKQELRFVPDPTEVARIIELPFSSFFR
jgi:hypothetical protein